MFINILSKTIATVSKDKQDNAIRHIEFSTTQTLKLGSVCGVEKEFPVYVEYVLDEETNMFILVSTSNYGGRYNCLVGSSYHSVEDMKTICLSIYKPEYL